MAYAAKPLVALHVAPQGVASSTPAAVSAQVEVRVQLTRAEGGRAGAGASEPSHRSRPRGCSRVEAGLTITEESSQTPRNRGRRGKPADQGGDTEIRQSYLIS